MGVLQDCMYGKLIFNYANCPGGGTYFGPFIPPFVWLQLSNEIIKLSIDDVCSIVFTEAGH